MILEFDSIEECMDYFNTYDGQNFKSADERNTLHGMEHDLDDLEPFLVHVAELYSRNVVVYAANSDMAKELAEELCEEGILLIDFDNFSDKNIETLRQAKETDLTIYQAFGPDKLPESLNIPLKDRIQIVEKNTVSSLNKNINKHEITIWQEDLRNYD